MARRHATPGEIDTALRIVEHELLTAVENTLNDEWAEVARAGYLDGDPGEAARRAEALADDELPAMIWLVAGIVALHGDGNSAWLTR